MYMRYVTQAMKVIQYLQAGESVAEKLAQLHREAPHNPPGLFEAQSGNHTAAANKIIPYLNRTAIASRIF